jgi:hypothetical protein
MHVFCRSSWEEQSERVLKIRGRACWPVVPATRETEVEGSQSKSSLGKS